MSKIDIYVFYNGKPVLWRNYLELVSRKGF